MFRNYGSMILKKGCILYHRSDSKFEYRNKSDKPFLFCSFHPLEFNGYSYNNNNDFVHYIKLKRDIRLFFMINNIENFKIESALVNFVDYNLSKMTDLNVLKKMSKLLKTNYFDGWFCSVENKANVEVALLNDRDIFKHYKSSILKNNWTNRLFDKVKKNNDKLYRKIRKKHWGKIYKICTIKKPVKLHINIRYKNLIEKYKKLETKYLNTLQRYVFQVILRNARIKYHNNKGDMVKK